MSINKQKQKARKFPFFPPLLQPQKAHVSITYLSSRYGLRDKSSYSCGKGVGQGAGGERGRGFCYRGTHVKTSKDLGGEPLKLRELLGPRILN